MKVSLVYGGELKEFECFCIHNDKAFIVFDTGVEYLRYRLSDIKALIVY